MANIIVLGNIVEDICVEVSDKKRFEAFTPNLSIEQVLALAEKEEHSLGEKAIVTKTLGGPALNWAQYLFPPHNVRIASVAGNGDQWERLKVILEGNLKVDITGIKLYPNKSLPQFALVYSLSEKKAHKWDTKIYWEENVASKFNQMELKRDTLENINVLALPITEPIIAKKNAERYCDMNPQGKVFYNPGRWLQRKDTSFEETYFSEIVKKANWVVLNRGEASVVQKEMHLSRIERLFDHNDRLELIILTRDEDGSYIYERRGQKKWDYKPRKKLIVNPGQALGAGDAYAATFLSRILMSNQDISDGQFLASVAAEEALSYVGALSQRRISGSTTVSEQLGVSRFTRRPIASK